MNESVLTFDDLMVMLDALLRDEGNWWDGFYTDRSRPVPFFVDVPNEDLVDWFDRGVLSPGRALDIGCGPGRNAVYLAEKGFRVDGVDVSPVSLRWAQERATAHGVSVDLHHKSIFDFEFEPGTYDFVYDSGCLHHVPPHRRLQFVPLVERALKPGGMFGLVCMRGECEMGGAEISDWEIYRGWTMQGGLAYSKERLLDLFGNAFDLLEHRNMRHIDPPAEVFGQDFLTVSLFRKK